MDDKFNLTGLRFGRLVVLSLYGLQGFNRKWQCRCDCGKECVKYESNLKQGNTVSCGCFYKETRGNGGIQNASNLIGKKFGRLIVISRSGSNGHKKAVWQCKCDCGGAKIVPTGALKSGNTTSCGCVQKETMHNIRWNFNLSTEDRETNRNRDMAVPGLHLWRQEIYRRDGYKCVVCGCDKSGSLIAHHINSWADNKRLRLSEDNGVTICVECHKEFHSKYGYGKNTLEQWMEFLHNLKRLMEA